MIKDNYGRTVNYLRLAVTDRCNLRCTYCMPSGGLSWLPRKDLMTYEELYRICSLTVKMGVEKIRITGGEPFLRKGLLSFLRDISQIRGLCQLSVTTNGLLTAPLVLELKDIGIAAVNLSLDTLDKDRFIQITRRDGLDSVMNTLDNLLTHGIPVKINAVVMEDHNIEDIVPLVRLTEKLPVSVRFIEEMPFNGGSHAVSLNWNCLRIREHIREHFPSMVKIPDPPNATAFSYKIPGYQGDIGIIAAYSRLFCGACNRIRITPTGMLRTCLYGHGQLNLRDALREGATDADLERMITQAVLKKPQDGWEAQGTVSGLVPRRESMATIGG